MPLYWETWKKPWVRQLRQKKLEKPGIIKILKKKGKLELWRKNLEKLELCKIENIKNFTILMLGTIVVIYYGLKYKFKNSLTILSLTL